MGVLGGLRLSADDTAIEGGERGLVFLAFAGPALFVSAPLLFLGYVLGLLVGNHHRSGERG